MVTDATIYGLGNWRCANGGLARATAVLSEGTAQKAASMVSIKVMATGPCVTAVWDRYVPHERLGADAVIAPDGLLGSGKWASVRVWPALG